MASPLRGIRVLELGQFITGPYCAVQLADLGADVIKIERPAGGDAFRDFGTAAHSRGYSHNFCAWNRGKRSVALDVTAARGRAVFLDLIERADVLIENFRPGVMARFDLGPEQIASSNPRLVNCSITGFAEDGPNRDRPAYDSVAQAIAGLHHTLVDPRDPRVLGPTIADQVTGFQATIAILGALRERDLTGRGPRVQITMADATAALIPDYFRALTQSGVALGSQSRAAASVSMTFRCADERMISMHVSSVEKFWRALFEVAERTELLTDERFRERANRIRNFSALIEELRPVFARKSSPEWLARLRAADVPAGLVNTIPDALTDPEFAHSGLFHEQDGQTIMRRAYRIDGARDAHPRVPPRLGEHTDAVLESIGYTRAALDLLRADQIIL